MGDADRISRRDLLRGRLLGRAADAASRAVNDRINTVAEAFARSGTGERRVSLPVHRPPGALEESRFLAECTRCGDCIAACPAHAIIPAPERFQQAAGTPMIDGASNPCIMCPDTPCITACKPGVLRADRPRKMGVAWIQNMACLAWTGSFCTVCSERCPVPGAIELDRGRPRIREDVCTGCGVCAAVCPAPANAVVLMPLADRPPSRAQAPFDGR